MFHSSMAYFFVFPQREIFEAKLSEVTYETEIKTFE